VGKRTCTVHELSECPARVRTLAPHHLQSSIGNLKSNIHRGHSSVGRAPALQVVRGERRLSRRNFSEGGPLPLCRHERSELRLGKPTMKNGKFFYIYILQSELDASRFYIGLTDDLRRRMRNHNAGRVLHTAKWRPWRLKTYIAFSDRVRAVKFERYLKSASGRAFLKKRL